MSTVPVDLGKRKRNAPDRYDPAAADSVVVTHDPSDGDGDAVARQKKRLRTDESTAFNAVPSLALIGGVCYIKTARMNARSKIEVSNYAFMTNRYLANHRGRKVKIKSTKRGRDAQSSFCVSVKKSNSDLFNGLNSGKTSKDKTFSVVGHVPDQALSGTQARQANVTKAGMYQAPGWLPMTKSANGLVAQLAGKTGQEVWEIQVDGAKPECLIELGRY